MGSVVKSHVNEFACPFHSAEGRLDDGFGLSYECDDSPVGRLSRVYVQYPDAS